MPIKRIVKRVVKRATRATQKARKVTRRATKSVKLKVHKKVKRIQNKIRGRRTQSTSPKVERRYWQKVQEQNIKDRKIAQEAGFTDVESYRQDVKINQMFNNIRKELFGKNGLLNKDGTKRKKLSTLKKVSKLFKRKKPPKR